MEGARNGHFRFFCRLFHYDSSMLIKYGIDGMEHCSLMDEETAQMIIDHDVYVVPTFCPYEEAVHYDLCAS